MKEITEEQFKKLQALENKERAEEAKRSIDIYTKRVDYYEKKVAECQEMGDLRELNNVEKCLRDAKSKLSEAKGLNAVLTEGAEQAFGEALMWGWS